MSEEKTRSGEAHRKTFSDQHKPRTFGGAAEMIDQKIIEDEFELFAGLWGKSEGEVFLPGVFFDVQKCSDSSFRNDRDRSIFDLAIHAIEPAALETELRRGVNFATAFHARIDVWTKTRQT